MLKIMINIAVTLSFNLKNFLKIEKKRAKKYLLCKKETFILRYIGSIFIVVPLYGDISIGILSSIENNANVTLLYNNKHVECKPFGVIALEKMLNGAVNPKECSDSIDSFYRSNPHDKVFAQEHLIVGQSYHFEQIKEGCVLYANGLETYSEMLLREGIAIIDPKFDNAEWNFRLGRAKNGAESQKMGLYITMIRKFCIKEEK